MSPTTRLQSINAHPARAKAESLKRAQVEIGGEPSEAAPAYDELPAPDRFFLDRQVVARPSRPRYGDLDPDGPARTGESMGRAGIIHLVETQTRSEPNLNVGVGR